MSLPPGAAATSWSRDRLCDLARGATVALRDADSMPLPIPEWLTAVSAGTDAALWGPRVAEMHPQDRPAVIATWWRTVEGPREARTVAYRSRSRGAVDAMRSTMVNLLADPLGGILVVTRGERTTESDVLWPTGTARPGTAWSVLYLSQFGEICRHEGAASELFGRPAHEIVGRRSIELIEPTDRNAMQAAWIEVMNDPAVSRTCHIGIIRPDGAPAEVEATIFNRMADPGVNAMMAVILDVTRQRSDEAELRRSREEFQTLAEQMPLPVFRADADGRLTFANQRWHELVGTRHGEPPLRIQDSVHAEDRLDVSRKVLALSAPFGPENATMEVRDVAGAHLFHLTLRAVGIRGGAKDSSILGSMQDITSTVALRHRADHDELTGLLNRAAIDRVVAEVLRQGIETVVAFVDLDGFKTVNDAHGHEAGDLVLRDIGDRLRRAVDAHDHVGRYGGDEFILVCTDVTAGAEAGIKRRLRLALEPRVRWAGGSWQPAASVGLTRVRIGDDAAAVLRRADVAMYRAKHRAEERR